MANEGISSNLDKLINIEKAKRTMVSGKNVTMKDVMEDLAEFCGVGYETIKFYKDEKTLPSLPVALRLSEYFGMSVNDLFTIEDYEEATKNIGKRGRKPRPYNKKCEYGDCENKVLAKGLCQRHYQQARSGMITIEE